MRPTVFIIGLVLFFFNLDLLYAQEAIPSVKAEMAVNGVGELVYEIPIDVLQGVNSFQPNIALGYNSRTGNGMAGWGWNVIGLSMITHGGKSKDIDGMTIGRQFDSTDPFYLDGQRLHLVSGNDYVTDKYSKIKITKQTGEYSFMIQYHDGKIAKYRELVPGQHYIAELKDALDNAVHYSYTTSNSTVFINTISYGGANASTDPFKVEFIYANRSVPVTFYRNNVQYKGTKVVSEIKTSSSYLTANSGIYRSYILSYDLIYANTVERLIKVEVKNGNGDSLKPLNFTYNNSTDLEITPDGSQTINRTPTPIKGLGGVAIGDFFGDGEPFPIYENKISATSYKLYNPKGGTIADYNESRQLFSGKVLLRTSSLQMTRLLT